MSFDLLRWLAEVSGPEWLWYAKYLSANDTLATGGHQAGFYLPRLVFGMLFPTASTSKRLNPDHSFPATVASEGVPRPVRAIWYNNRVVGKGTRNECRITGWGGATSPILDPEATGSLAIFAFHRGPKGDADECRVWLCADAVEETIALEWLGSVEPGSGVLFSPSGQTVPEVVTRERDRPCTLRREEIPADWLRLFPDASTIVQRSVEHTPTARSRPPDERLVRRRDCEYELFRSIEEAHVLPRIQEGFASVDLFVSFANAVTNRRKARSGSSLELQAKCIFAEEGLPCSHDEVSEHNKRPDFLFPSAERYRDRAWPAAKLRLLAAKTTCKDRWRQVLDEAERIPVKHLLTLQEGVSVSQFRQMKAGGIRLVVPRPLHRSYPEAVRSQLMSLTDFIAETARVCAE